MSCALFETRTPVSPNPTRVHVGGASRALGVRARQRQVLLPGDKTGRNFNRDGLRHELRDDGAQSGRP